MLEIRTVQYPLQNSLASEVGLWQVRRRRGRNHTRQQWGEFPWESLFQPAGAGRFHKPVSAPTVGNGKTAVGCSRSCRRSQERLRGFSALQPSCPSSRADDTSPHSSLTGTVHSECQQNPVLVRFVGWLQKPSK